MDVGFSFFSGRLFCQHVNTLRIYIISRLSGSLDMFAPNSHSETLTYIKDYIYFTFLKTLSGV